jgi:hypothetical protein
MGGAEKGWWEVSKFKVGDRVVCMGGHTGGIAHIDFYKGECGVRLDGAPLPIVFSLSDIALCSPVRTVTRKEIVPGRYGVVEVIGGPTNAAILRFHPNDGMHYLPDDLTAAIETLTAIRDALDGVA